MRPVPAHSVFVRIKQPAILAGFALVFLALNASLPTLAEPRVALAEMPPQTTAVPATLPQAIEKRLAAGLKSQDVTDAILQAYKTRNFEPRWLKNAAPNDHAKAMLATFDTAHFYGLRKQDYAIAPLPTSPSTDELARYELAVTEAALTYARHAMQGRIVPGKVHPFITPTKPELNAQDALKTLFELDQPATALRLYHPPHEGFVRLQKVLQKILAEQKTAENDNEDAELLTAAIPTQQKFSTTPNAKMIADIVANMERWRWLPRNIGHSYIWANIPSYVVQIKSLEEVTFETRTVVGAPKTPTPVFSEMMTHVIVNPSWHVPPSIAKKEMLPALQRDSSALERKGIQVVSLANGRVVDPSTVDWGNASTLRYAFRQPPSERNALGKIKFLFPNQHSVYMHDTQMKSFFEHSRRAYSHGCVRIHEPLRFADAIFQGDENWNGEKISRLFGSGERRIDLKTALPVHIVYFTIEADAFGNLRELEDPYGYHKTLKALMGI